MALMPPKAAPAAPAPQDNDDANDALVCIYRNEDGSFRVEIDADAQADLSDNEPNEGAENEAAEKPVVKTASSVGQVLQIVGQALGSGNPSQFDQAFKQAAK